VRTQSPDAGERGGARAVLLAIWRSCWPAIVAAFVYTGLCIAKSGPLGLIAGKTWLTWLDQAQYLKSTLAFARGDLSPSEHWYPLLYSALAVPFVPLLPRNPFLPLDILCAAWIAQSVTRVGYHLQIRRGTSLIVLLGTLAWPPQLWNAWVAPWTTTLSAALLWWLMARTGDVAFGDRPITTRQALAIGCVVAAIPLTRPADAPIALLFGVAIGYLLIRRGTWRGAAVLAGLAAAVITIGLYGALHLAIYGARASDYMILSGNYGLYFADLPWKAAILFVDSTQWFGGVSAELDRSLLDRMPWLLVGLAGATLVFVREREADRRVYIMILGAAVAANVVLMLAYVDLLPTGLWRHANVHYFKWAFPLLGLFAWRLVRDARSSPKLAAACLLGWIALSGFRLAAVPALPGDIARRIDFAAPTGSDFDSVYFSPSVIVDGERPRRNLFEYHQVLAGDRVLALSLRDGFTARERWYPSGTPATAWPTGIPVPKRALAAAPPVAPVARWKPQLVWGVPCWIASCAVTTR
jgi:hypothetical protein